MPGTHLRPLQRGGVLRERRRLQGERRQHVLRRDLRRGGDLPLVAEDTRRARQEGEEELLGGPGEERPALVVQVEPPLRPRRAPGVKVQRHAHPLVKESRRSD
eukprot:5405093-Pyramimonas_sp.AAC.1